MQPSNSAIATPASSLLGWPSRLILGFLVVCCSPPVEPARPIRIGVITPLSGPFLDIEGGQTRDAALLAASQVNGAGGLRVGTGRRLVELVFEDSEDRPEAAVNAARKLINQQQVVALVGPVLSRNAVAVATVAESLQIPMISPTATHPAVTAGKRFVFRVAFVDDVQGRALARFAHEELAAGKAAVLYDVANVYNRRIAEIFRQVFEQIGGRVVAFESYTSGDVDFEPQLIHIRAAEPDVLLLPNYADEVGLQVEQARRLGLGIPVLGGDAWAAARFAVPEDFAGSFFTDHWHVGVTNDPTPAFVEAYRSLYQAIPTSGAALTYDALGILFRAIETKGTGGEALRQGLASTERYQGVTGSISFPDGGDPAKSVVIVEINDGEARFHRQVRP